MAPSRLIFASTLSLASFAFAAGLRADNAWIVYEGGEGPGKGKHVVLVSGDEEYRSEEALPQLGAILAYRHGFKCTVLFAIDKQDGTINPNEKTNIPGLEALGSADAMIIATRFRDLPDDQMKHIVDFVENGGSVIGLRTATHAFNLSDKSAFAKWDWKSRDWDGGFGRQVLGETWINHHGAHGSEATRGILAEDRKDHPILRGIEPGSIFGPTDVYGVRLPLPGDSAPLVYGQVVAGMKEGDPAVEGAKNDPMMPVAWTKTFETSSGAKAKIFTTTMGASQDLLSEGFRRLLVNATYWATGLEVPAKADVALVGDYQPTKFGFNGYTKGKKPADLKAARPQG